MNSRVNYPVKQCLVQMRSLESLILRILSIDTVLLGLQFESLKLEQAYWFNLGTIIVYLVRQVMNINLDKIVYYNYQSCI